MHWRDIADELPTGEVLVWSDGRAVVAIVVPADEQVAYPTFVDARVNEPLPWPTHWMPLPPAPAAVGQVSLRQGGSRG
jgi:hypothetical protein